MPKKEQNKNIEFKYNLDRKISKRLSYVYQLLVPANAFQENIEKKRPNISNGRNTNKLKAKCL